LKKLVTPFRVGLLVIASGVFLFVFFTFTRKGGLSEDESIGVHASFRNASGLGPKSRVQLAGIPVGEITAIRLEGTRARVELRIRREVDLRTDAALIKRSESLLGDYLLDLNPGTPAAPPMPEGGEIKTVVDEQGMEKLLESVNTISADVQEVTRALREVLGGEKGERSLQAIVDNLEQLSRNANDTVVASQAQLADILRNVERITAEVRTLTEGNDERLQAIVENIEVITRDTREVMATVRQTVSGADGGELQEGMASIKDTLQKLDQAVSNVEEVTRKIRDGEGTVGKLVSDERLGERLAETVEDVADLANTLTRTQLQVGIRSEYLFAQGSAKNFFEARLATQPDRYYLLQVVDDPRGFTETVTVRNNPPGRDEPASQVQRITRDQLKFSAQFAKRFYFTTLRLGVTENTGGLGADLHFFEDTLTLRNDLFNLSVSELRYPRLRSSLQLRAFEHLYATVGVDDLLNPQVRDQLTNQLLAGRDFFVGAGVAFTDDDLKALLPFLPVP
jgi:phospholipid/cholesterol/gamma-HCH transport system substrate-binding protein